MRNAATDEEGAALVEFAIVVSLLVMLVFGIIEFGRAYNAQVTLTHAAREGVRELAVTGDQSAAEGVTVDAAASLDPAFLSVVVGTCSPGEQAVVTASYPLEYDIPFFGSQVLTLDSTAVMRCGG